MINGTHVIISSTKPEADRKFFMDVLGLPHIDVGRGWIIFGLPPSEMAVHPATKNNEHEFYLMVEDIKVFTQKMSARKIKCTKVQDAGWGLLTRLSLPGGGKIGVYEPRHKRPKGS